VRAKDTPGFIVNHAGRGYGTEALRILGRASRNSTRSTAFCATAPDSASAPSSLLDLTGLDVSHPVMDHRGIT